MLIASGDILVSGGDVLNIPEDSLNNVHQMEAAAQDLTSDGSTSDVPVSLIQ
jgi:hypothetical protein